MKKELAYIVCFILLCMICFSGCSSSVATETTVFEDIKASDTYCSLFEFEYDSMEVVKRMTDEEKKIDSVYVVFDCHNNDFKYSVECVVKYVLYNEGWMFEEYNIIDSSYTVIKKPDLKTVSNDYPYLESVEEINDTPEGIDSNPNYCCFEGYSQEKISEYFSWDNYCYISYSFTPETGWISNTIDNTKHQNWNWNAFVGEWRIESGEIENLKINQISSNSAAVEYNHYGEILNKTFNLEYVTGGNSSGVFDYPDDVPIYKLSMNFYKNSYSCMGTVYFTPYGLYDFVSKDNKGNHFDSQFTKLS